MTIFHLSVKAVSRSDDRSATAAAAYRAGCSIKDERTRKIHDYTRKLGVVSADIVLPIGAPEWATDRAKLWNAAESAEKRKDACVAREYEVALPSELSPAQRRLLALDFARDMAHREGCAVDVAIHAPRRISDSELEKDPNQHYETDPETGQRHNGNHHAHILRTTRKLEPDGMGAKLDTEKAGRKRSDDLEAVRKKWAELTNERLRLNGITARVDHRSLEMQGIVDREPTLHLGPAAIGYERRTGLPSDLRMQHEREAQERLVQAKALGELERRIESIRGSLFDLSCDISAAKSECEELREQQKIEDIKEHFERQRQSTEATRAVAEAVPESPPIIVPPSVPAEPIAPSALSKMFQNLKKFFVAPVAEPPKPAPSIKFGLGSKTEPRPEQVPEPVPVVPKSPGTITFASKVVPVPELKAEPAPPVVPVRKVIESAAEPGMFASPVAPKSPGTITFASKVVLKAEPVPVVPEPVVPVSAPTLLERPVPVPRPEPVTPVVPVPRPEPAAAVAAERKAETKAAAERKAETKAAAERKAETKAAAEPKAEPVVPVVPVVPAAPSFSPPAPSAQNWPVVRSYLIEIRRFSADLVDELHEAGYVYADQFANAVFVLDSSRGVALQSTVDDSFYYLRGEKGAFTLLGSEQVAFTESCIDAISFRELGYEGEIVSTCGLSAASVRELADQYRKIGYKIVAAYDDDAMANAIGADLHIVPEGATTWNAELVLKDSHDVNDEAAAEPERPEPEPQPTIRMKR